MGALNRSYLRNAATQDDHVPDVQDGNLAWGGPGSSKFLACESVLIAVWCSRIKVHTYDSKPVHQVGGEQAAAVQHRLSVCCC